jgi:hypothetical protein
VEAATFRQLEMTHFVCSCCCLANGGLRERERERGETEERERERKRRCLISSSIMLPYRISHLYNFCLFFFRYPLHLCLCLIVDVFPVIDNCFRRMLDVEFVQVSQFQNYLDFLHLHFIIIRTDFTKSCQLDRKNLFSEKN